MPQARKPADFLASKTSSGRWSGSWIGPNHPGLGFLCLLLSWLGPIPRAQNSTDNSIPHFHGLPLPGRSFFRTVEGNTHLSVERA